MAQLPYPAARAGRSVGVSWLFRASGPLGFARPAAWGEGAGPAGSPRGAGLRLLGPNSPVPTATTINSRDPQTSIFHLTVPPRPQGARFHCHRPSCTEGTLAPSPQPRIRAVPAPGRLWAQLWPLGQPGRAPGNPLAVSPGHRSLSACCPLAPVPSREPPTGLPCHR